MAEYPAWSIIKSRAFNRARLRRISIKHETGLISQILGFFNLSGHLRVFVSYKILKHVTAVSSVY